MDYCEKCTNSEVIFCKPKDLFFSFLENIEYTYNVKYKSNCGVVLSDFTWTTILMNLEENHYGKKTS